MKALALLLFPHVCFNSVVVAQVLMKDRDKSFNTSSFRRRCPSLFYLITGNCILDAPWWIKIQAVTAVWDNRLLQQNMIDSFFFVQSIQLFLKWSAMEMVSPINKHGLARLKHHLVTPVYRNAPSKRRRMCIQTLLSTSHMSVSPCGILVGLFCHLIFATDRRQYNC